MNLAPLRSRAALALLWLLATAGVCAAQNSPILWGNQQKRLVRLFDFEERQAGNYEDLPMHWYAIGRPAHSDDPNFHRQPMHQQLIARRGFPGYTLVRFDEAQRTSGTHSFHLGLNGGSAGAFLEAGTIPAVPNSDYLVTANVTTTPLKFAAARLVAYFIDDQGRKIEASVSASEPIRLNGSWTTAAVKLPGEFNNAAYVGIQVELMQPERDGDSALSDRQIVYQDVRGGAWFDDIAVWQLPNVHVHTQSPVNIVRSPGRPELSMKVRDLTGRSLLARTAVYDHAGRLVTEARNIVGDGAPSSWRWLPPVNRFGWYLVDLTVHERGRTAEEDNQLRAPVARSLNAFLWLPPESALDAREARRFTLSAEDVPNHHLALVPDVLDQTGLGSVVLSAWGREPTRNGVQDRQARLDELLQSLLARGTQVTLSLSPIPPELAQALDIDPEDPLAMFTKSESAWMPYIAPMMMHLGQRTRLWQIGSTDKPYAFYFTDLPALTRDIDRHLRDLAPQPSMVLPWRLDQSRRTEMTTPALFFIDVPPAVRPDTLAAHLAEWQGKAEAEKEDAGTRGRGDAESGAAPASARPGVAASSVPFWLRLREPDATQMPQATRIDDLILRMLYAWEAGVEGLSIARPWADSTERKASVVPDPLLGVFRTVSHRLAGRKAIGRLPLADGMRGMIFDGPAGGMLAVWNESATDEQAVLDMYLGGSPVAIDAWGNRAEVPLVNQKHRLALSRTPLFIEGIDAALAKFRGTFALDPDVLESKQTLHEANITITNPWPRTISGTMLFTDPDNWEIEPRRTQFSIASGQSTTIPVRIRFPVSETAGRKQVTARFDFGGDQDYAVDLNAAVTLGLKDVTFDATVSIEPGAGQGVFDAVVTQMVTNTGDKTLALYAFAYMPGYPRQERIIAQLKPGQSILRRFRFAGAGAKLHDTPVRVGLRETDGPAVLNQLLTAAGE